MNASKTITLAIAGLLAVAFSLFLVQLIVRKVKSRSEDDGKLKLSYGIWFSTLLLAISLVQAKTMEVLGEAIDQIYKIDNAIVQKESAKSIALFIGLGAAWFILWLFISNLLAVVFVGKRKALKELEGDNWSYFLIKGVMTIGFIICLQPVFESLLRTFMPSIGLPFYH